VSRQAGIDFTHVNGASADKHFEETMGSGGLFLDADGDGWLDIFLVDGGSRADAAVDRTARHRLYRNRRNGTFQDVTTSTALRRASDGGYGMGACAGDYDNDGRTDIYVTNAGPDTLYRNQPNGTFADVTKKAGLGSPLWGTSCAFVDIDLDGDLDLFVTNYVDMGTQRNRFCGNTTPRLRAYCHPLTFPPSPNLLYRNDGGGGFSDITARAGVAGHRGNGLGVAIADYDDDRWPDVFVANDGLPNFLFRNQGRGSFSETGLVAGVAVAADGSARAGMGTAFADYDGDGRLDLVVTNHETEMHSLFRNAGGGLFGDATAASGIGRATLPYVGFGVVFADYDNDADPDLAIVNGHVIDNIARFRSGATHAQPRLLLQNTNGRLRDVSRESGPGFAGVGVGRALAAGDIDNDGDLDLLVTNNGDRAELLRNDGGNRRQALVVLLIGTASNRDAIGARATLTAGGVTRVREVTSGSSYLAQNDLRLHFGLGDAARAEKLEIRWPSGKVESLTNLDADQIVTVREGQGIVARLPFTK
jgi:enediyne biosynthesis protein E4